MVQTKSKNNRTEQDDEEGLFTPVITGGDEATENTDTEQLPNEAEGGDGVFTPYMEKMTPRGSPDTIKQMLAMILSALLGAILMILILGGRKTYNITEQVVAPPSASTNDVVVQGNTTTLVSEEYQLRFNSGTSSYGMSDKEFEQACIKLDEITEDFVDGLIHDFYVGFPTFKIEKIATVGVGTCTNGNSYLTTRFQTSVVFANDSIAIPSNYEIGILLMDHFTDPSTLASYKSAVREELSQIRFFQYAARAGSNSPTFTFYNLVN